MKENQLIEINWDQIISDLISDVKEKKLNYNNGYWISVKYTKEFITQKLKELGVEIKCTSKCIYNSNLLKIKKVTRYIDKKRVKGYLIILK